MVTYVYGYELVIIKRRITVYIVNEYNTINGSSRYLWIDRYSSSSRSMFDDVTFPNLPGSSQQWFLFQYELAEDSLAELSE